MKTIVVATDFSAISLNAAEYAADLAVVINADLALINVCPVPVQLTDGAGTPYTLEEMVADTEEKIKKLREDLLVRTHDRIRVHTEVREGKVVKELNDYCAGIHPYVVVMGAERTDGLERLLLGGKTVSAVRQLTWPLIVVPPDVKFAAIRKIGLACDLIKVEETIPFNEIKSLVRAFGAELHVLHASPGKGRSLSEEKIEGSEWIRDLLFELGPKYHFIDTDDIEKGIADFADANDLDMLIIIPKKHSLISRIFQHGHSRKLVLHTHVPIMAVHE